MIRVTQARGVRGVRILHDAQAVAVNVDGRATRTRDLVTALQNYLRTCNRNLRRIHGADTLFLPARQLSRDLVPHDMVSRFHLLRNQGLSLDSAKTMGNPDPTPTRVARTTGIHARTIGRNLPTTARSLLATPRIPTPTIRIFPRADSLSFESPRPFCARSC